MQEVERADRIKRRAVERPLRVSSFKMQSGGGRHSVWRCGPRTSCCDYGAWLSSADHILAAVALRGDRPSHVRRRRIALITTMLLRVFTVACRLRRCGMFWLMLSFRRGASG